MNKIFRYIAIAFVLLLVSHICFWTQCVHEPLSKLFQFYIFFVLMNSFIFTLLYIIYQTGKDYLGFSMIGIIFLKFIFIFLIIKKLQLNQLAFYQLQILVPYLLSIIALTMSAITLLKTDKKH